MLRYLQGKRRKVTGGLIISLGAMWLSFAIAPCVLAADITERAHHCLHTQSTSGQSPYLPAGDHCPFCNPLTPVVQNCDHVVNPLTISSHHVHPVVSGWTYVQPFAAIQLLPVTVSADYLPVHPTLRFCVLLI